MANNDLKMANNDLIRRKDILDAMHDIPYADPRAFSVPLEKVMNAIANVPGVTVAENEPSMIEGAKINVKPWDFKIGGDFVGECISDIRIGDFHGINRYDWANLMVNINQIIKNNIKAAIRYGEAKAKRELTPIDIGDVYDMGSDGVAIVIGFNSDGDVHMLMDDNTIETKYRIGVYSNKKLSHLDLMAETMAILDNIRKENKGE